MKKLINALLSLSKTIGMVCLWFLFTVLITNGISQLEKEYYTPTDTPNPRFTVVVKSDNGEGYIPKNWQQFKNEGGLPYAVSNIDCIEDCFKRLENGNYLYVDESALLAGHSEYQIKDGKIIPISYKTINFGQMLIAMFLAFLILSFLKYLYAVYQIRNDKTTLIAYHKKLGKELLIFVGIVGTVWTLIYLNAK